MSSAGGMPSGQVLARTAALGLVSGGRSTAGVAAVAKTAPRYGPAAQPLAALRSDRGRRLSQLALAGELVADALPGTPSRLMPPALAVRAAAGALSSYALAQRLRAPTLLPAALGAAGALAGSVLGARWRSAVAGRGGPDLPAALLEDVVVLLLAAAAVARR